MTKLRGDPLSESGSPHQRRVSSRTQIKIRVGLFVLLLGLGVATWRIWPHAAAATTGYETVVLRFDVAASGFGFISDLVLLEDGRLFVAEKSGRILVANPDGTILPEPFLDLRSKVGSEGEQGLTGLVLHPDYETNPTFYIHYTDLLGVTHLASFRTMESDPNQADPKSETTLLEVLQPTDIHNGAGITFGPDGYLYFGLGDGGYYNDPDNNGQNGNTLLGSILRLDVDGLFPYEIPPDNPFVGNSDVLDEIWALGLRNPWRFTFDSLTGDFYVTDVGETLWEELNLEPAGSAGGNNYGWRCYQGNMPYILEGCGPAENYTFPVYVRSHATMCAIIGGYVYRGSQYPMIEGHYLFADLCSGRVSGLVQEPDDSWTIASAGRLPNGGITTFAQGHDNELYIVSYGTVYRIWAEIITLTPQAFMPIVRN